MNARKEKAAVAREIKEYVSNLSRVLDFDPETPIHRIAPFITDIDNAIYELEDGNFEKARANLHWLKLTTAMGDAKRRGNV